MYFTPIEFINNSGEFNETRRVDTIVIVKTVKQNITFLTNRTRDSDPLTKVVILLNTEHKLTLIVVKPLRKSIWKLYWNMFNCLWVDLERCKTVIE